MAKKQKLEIGSSNLISVKPITDNQKIVFETWKEKKNLCKNIHENWLCHSIYTPETQDMSKRDVNMVPVHREAFPPKARVY